MAISAIFAPRERMAGKASCPGGAIKVKALFFRDQRAPSQRLPADASLTSPLYPCPSILLFYLQQNCLDLRFLHPFQNQNQDLRKQSPLFHNQFSRLRRREFRFSSIL